mgnify:FL=1|jgi:hypothetical protein
MFSSKPNNYHYHKNIFPPDENVRIANVKYSMDLVLIG